MRVWFITGASRGFGALITAQALAAGDAVIATARDPQTVAKIAEKKAAVTAETAQWHDLAISTDFAPLHN